MTENELAMALACIGCGTTEGVEMECSRTRYPFDGEIGSLQDPNRDIPLCRECAVEHHRNWDDRWADYWNSVFY